MVDMCREKKTGIWQKSAVKVTESERLELVLNAVFYWEPVEFFQKRCDMITLRFFQDEPCDHSYQLCKVDHSNHKVDHLIRRFKVDPSVQLCTADHCQMRKEDHFIRRFKVDHSVQLCKVDHCSDA